jgi:hypothetical protein
VTQLRALLGLLLLLHNCHLRPPCAPGHNWHGDRCLANDCKKARADAFCALANGDTGNCLGDSCQSIDFTTNDNCGRYGASCPTGYPCVVTNGVTHCSNNSGYFYYVCEPDALCPAGQQCSDGACMVTTCAAADEGKACVPSSTGEYAGYPGVCCGTSCLPAYASAPAEYAPFDDNHCGGCGIACDSKAACILSYTSYTASCEPKSCRGQPEGSTCSKGDAGAGSCCDGVCSLLADSESCGACELECPQGLACGGPGYGCEPPSGDCTTTPCPTGWGCEIYGCRPADCTGLADGTYCAPDSSQRFGLCCGETCTRAYDDDPSNCGACGATCPPEAICYYGTCAALVDCSQNADGVFCLTDSGESSREGFCCGGKCTVPETPCGWTCPDAGVLTNGQCVQPDSGVFLPCQADTPCPAGYGCATGTCLQDTCPTSFDDSPCALDGGSDAGILSGICCAGQCAEINASSIFGSLCSLQCAVGAGYVEDFLCPISAGCAAGQGGTCPSGTACIGQADCAPLSCQGVNDWEFCAYGRTPGEYLGALAVGYSSVGICCGGRCVDSQNDPYNCWSCGAVCAPAACGPNGKCGLANCAPDCPAGSVCVNGACYTSVCDPAPVYPNPQPCAADDGTAGLCCAGACQETQNDPKNCGGCGVQCPAGQSCEAGVCSGTPASCSGAHAYQFCDVADASLSKICCPAIGCTDLATDTSNCGACNFACPSGDTCVAGVCSSSAANASPASRPIRGVVPRRSP